MSSYNLLDYWNLYNRESTAPDSFIEMSLYFMISAALQRRVWLQSVDRAIFPNQYYILCGPPGVGKGLVLKPLSYILRYHKIDPLKNLEEAANKAGTMPPEEVQAILAAAKEVQEKERLKLGDDWESPLRIPVAAQSTTFESLVNTHAKAVSRINPSNPDPSVCRNGTYAHSSLTIILEEMSTLFRKHTDDLTQYLIAGYDCLDVYEYKTKHAGKDRVKKGCINMIAGTTPEFLQSSQTEKNLGDGFFSRIMLIFESRNRGERFEFPETTQEQKLAHERILSHIERLTTLFGQIKYEPEAYEYVRYYVEEIMPRNIINPDPKLEYYYSRKKLHLQKLIIAHHFSSSLDMTIRLKSCEYCINLLNKQLEPKMHLALAKAGRNPLSDTSSKILRYLQRAGSQTYIQIWIKFESDVKEAELIETLKGMEERGQIRKIPKNNQLYYDAV